MLSLGIGLTSVPVLARRGPAYDPYAAALFARLPATPSALRRRLVNDLIVNLRDHAIFETKWDGFFPIAMGMDDPGYATANDAFSARRNWVQDAYNLTVVGAPAFATDRGYTGDGVAAYLDTGANRAALTKYSRDSAALIIWENQETTSSGAAIGSPPSTTQATINPKGPVGFIGRINDTGVQSGIASSMGLSAADRPDSTNSFFYRDGSQVFTAAVSSLALTTGNFTLFAGNGGTANFRASRLACAGFGASLGASGHAALYAALNTYLIAVGAN